MPLSIQLRTMDTSVATKFTARRMMARSRVAVLIDAGEVI